MFRYYVSGLFLSVGLVWNAHAGQGLDYLEKFLQTAHSAKAEFTQTVQTPSKRKADLARGSHEPQTTSVQMERSQGYFIFQRPGLLRFEYTAPFAQTIVADGHNVWLYDHDLEQVTRRAQGQVLNATPVALLTTARNLAGLAEHFHLSEEADTSPADTHGVAHWVRAEPKAAKNQQDGAVIVLARMGFGAGGELVVLEMHDAFGQISRLHFEKIQLTPKIDAGTFRFTPPKGVSMIGQ